MSSLFWGWWHDLKSSDIMRLLNPYAGNFSTHVAVDCFNAFKICDCQSQEFSAANHEFSFCSKLAFQIMNLLSLNHGNELIHVTPIGDGFAPNIIWKQTFLYNFTNFTYPAGLKKETCFSPWDVLVLCSILSFHVQYIGYIVTVSWPPSLDSLLKLKKEEASLEAGKMTWVCL